MGVFDMSVLLLLGYLGKSPQSLCRPIRVQYTECKYGGPLGHRPGRVA